MQTTVFLMTRVKVQLLDKSKISITPFLPKSACERIRNFGEVVTKSFVSYFFLRHRVF